MINPFNSFLRRIGIEIRRVGPRQNGEFYERVISLSPKEPRIAGRVLISYVIEPFLLAEGEQVSNAHTQHWESWRIVETFRERGFLVDVISYHNRKFQPAHSYDFFLSARTNLQRVADSLNSDCKVIAHLDTAHWLFNNGAAYERLLDLQRRKGITLRNLKMVEPNWAIEHASMGTVLGNKFTMDTYTYAKKPLHRIPISVPEIYDWDDEKDFEACKNTYLWFGSSGFVHKGLDLVLEAFAEMPDKRLIVCGPFNEEPEFLEAYRRELFELPNIEAPGWLDVSSPSFNQIMRRCVGLVYPTCSEGGGGSVLTCMHGGLIPIVSVESSVDVDDTGTVLRENSISEIKAQVEALSARPPQELQDLARAAWSLARARHTRQIFADSFSRFVDGQLLSA